MLLRLCLALVCAVTLAVAGPAEADGCASVEINPNTTVERAFSNAQVHAVELQRYADLLMLYARRPDQYSFESVAVTLNGIVRLENKVSKDVCRLKALLGKATEGEAASIEVLRLNLNAVARWTGRAIQLFNSRNTMADLYGPEFQTAVRELYADAKALRKGAPTLDSRLTD